jgi:hypothetical protein
MANAACTDMRRPGAFRQLDPHERPPFRSRLLLIPMPRGTVQSKPTRRGPGRRQGVADWWST